jgi:hypothetical protein
MVHACTHPEGVISQVRHTREQVTLVGLDIRACTTQSAHTLSQLKSLIRLNNTPNIIQLRNQTAGERPT